MSVVYGISNFIDTDELALVSGSGGWTKDDAAAYAEGLPLLQLYDMQADPGEKNNLCGQDLDLKNKYALQEVLPSDE